MKGLTLVELIVSLGIVFVLIGVVLSKAIHFSSVREGQHTGYLTAIQPEGYFFPNNHVYFKTDNSSSQEDSYCINRNNTKLISEARKYNQQRKLVTITFSGVRGFGWDLCRYQEISKIELDK